MAREKIPSVVNIPHPSHLKLLAQPHIAELQRPYIGSKSPDKPNLKPLESNIEAYIMANVVPEGSCI